MEDYNIQTNTNINIDSLYESVYVKALKKISLTSKYDDVEFTTYHGNMNMTSNNNINIKAQQDDISIMSLHGNINMNSDGKTKIVSNETLINTKKSIHLKSKTENILLETLIADVNINSKNDVNIVSLDNNINIIGNNDITLSTNVGNVSVNSYEGIINENAYLDINITSKTGNINIESVAGSINETSLDDLSLTSSNGAININSSENISLITGSNNQVTANNIINAPYIWQASYLLVPTGGIMPFAGTSSPGGWLLCDGTAISRSTYSILFLVIGTTYGSGNGTTTFNLPDFRNRMPIGVSESYNLGITGGASTKTLSISEIPAHTHTGTTDSSGSHTHSVNDPGHNHQYYMSRDDGNSSNNAGQNPAGDAFGSDYGNNTSTSTTGITINSNGSHTHSFTTNNTGGSNSFSIMPPYLAVNYIIKY